MRWMMTGAAGASPPGLVESSDEATKDGTLAGRGKPLTVEAKPRRKGVLSPFTSKGGRGKRSHIAPRAETV